MHDNDFGEELYFLGFYLRKYLRYNHEYLDKVSNDKLRSFCVDFFKLHYYHLNSFYKSQDENTINTTLKYFEDKLEINFLSDVEIINNNGEDLYISLSNSDDYGYYWIQ